MQMWQTKKLGEVLEYEQPTDYIVESKNYKDEYETPVLTAGKSFILGKTKEKNGIFPALKLPVIIFDDFTTATKFVDFPFKVKSSAMKILHPIKKISDAKFLFYMMQTIDFDHTGIHKRYWISEYSKIEIPLPPIAEQKRTVKILDDTFDKVVKAKENAEKNFQNSKELFESYLQDIFSNPGKDWEEKTLGEIVETTQGVQIIKGLQLKNPKIGYRRYLYISDFNHEKNLKYVQDIYPKKLVTPDDLIVVNTGASAGKIYRGIDGVLSNNLFKVSISKDVLATDFLYYFVISNVFKNFQKKIVRGTANPHMGHENFNLTPFYLPKLSEQKIIVKKLDTLSDETKKLEGIYFKKLENLEELKKSILQKAFSGAI